MKATPITNISVMGIVEGTYDIAHLDIRILTQAPTAAAAREELIKPAAALDAIVKALPAGTTSNVRASISTVPEFDKKGKVVLYSAWRLVHLETTDLEGLGSIIGAAADIPGCSIPSPTFKVRDIAPLHAQALKDAKQRLDETFRQECEVFGKDPSNYEVCDWQARYDNREAGSPRGRRMYAAGALMQEGMAQSSGLDDSIESGKPQVMCHLTASFIPKGTRRA